MNDPSAFMFHRTFMNRFLAVLAVLAATFAVVLPASAQFKLDVSGVGMTQIPIAVTAFRGEDAIMQKISAIVLADLARSGRFRAIDHVVAGMDENARPDVSALRQKGADASVAGSVSRLADGRLDVRFRLWDVVKGSDLGAASHVVSAANVRLAAHLISDFIYEKLTGEKGVFSTRIAYVTKSGARYNLWVADADGENAQSALSSPQPIISPTWLPNGTQITYVSFEANKPQIWTHEVATGRRSLLANYKGSNSAPAWSPDGRTLALTLTMSGNTQIYALPVGTSEPRRLTQSDGIDTEAQFSADGRSIYFVSDRGGSPQIYRMAASGGSAERITFNGGYNISPALSPDGRWMAYISRVGSAYKLHVMDLSTQTSMAITDSWSDERPSFAANSKLIVYATKLQGAEAMMTTTVDGRIKARLAGVAGDIREPAWGPYGR